MTGTRLNFAQNSSRFTRLEGFPLEPRCYAWYPLFDAGFVYYSAAELC